MRVRFWASAAGAAVGFTLLVILAIPWEALGAESVAERRRMTLLTMWTSGVMCICFGAAGLASAVVPIGFRDVAEVGSVTAAIEERRETRRRQGASPFHNFAGWVVVVGGMLIVNYFILWSVS